MGETSAKLSPSLRELCHADSLDDVAHPGHLPAGSARRLHGRAVNVWSLYGLAECLRITGRDTEARAVTASFEKVGEHANVEIIASCFCRICLTVDDDRVSRKDTP